MPSWWPGSGDKPEETPGAKAERERQERQARDEKDRQQRARRAERDKARYAARKAAGEHPGRPGRPTEVPAGQNEAAVIEYLRRHPNATATDVAFHAIYGGGTTAWEGLHPKTRRNASGEARRVLQRLQNKGAVRQSGWTGGGKPKWDITDKAPEPDEEKIARWFGRPGEKGTKRGRGAFGFFSEATPAERDEPKGKGGGGGKSYGVTRPADSGDDNGGDDDGDDGGGAGIFKKAW